MRASSPPYAILVLTRDGDVMLFEEPRAAESYLEPIDVAAGEYPRIVDTDGVVWRATVGHDYIGPWLLRTRIEVTRLVSEARDPEALRAAIEALRSLMIALAERRGEPVEELLVASMEAVIHAGIVRLGWG